MVILIVKSRLINTQHVRDVRYSRQNVIEFHYSDDGFCRIPVPEDTDVEALLQDLAELWNTNRVINLDSWVKKFKKAESTENGKPNCSGECQSCRLSFDR